MWAGGFVCPPFMEAGHVPCGSGSMRRFRRAPEHRRRAWLRVTRGLCVLCLVCIVTCALSLCGLEGHPVSHSLPSPHTPGASATTARADPRASQSQEPSHGGTSIFICVLICLLKDVKGKWGWHTEQDGAACWPRQSRLPPGATVLGKAWSLRNWTWPARASVRGRTGDTRRGLACGRCSFLGWREKVRPAFLR